MGRLMERPMGGPMGRPMGIPMGRRMGRPMRRPIEIPMAGSLLHVFLNGDRPLGPSWAHCPCVPLGFDQPPIIYRQA